MPSESRLTPAARKAANFSASAVPGLASSVISTSCASGRRARMAVRMASMACPENRLGVPPPKKRLTGLRPAMYGREASRSAISAAT